MQAKNSVIPTDYVGRVPLLINGCFREELLYFLGDRRDELARFGRVRLIEGFRGLETELLVWGIFPCGTFVVVAA
jgi:hypothetical protein